MHSYIIIEYQGMDPHLYVRALANYADEILCANYFYPGASLIWTNSERESERCYSVECRGITGVRDVTTEVRSPIRHIDLNLMLVEIPCRIWDLETQGVQTEVQDAKWCYSEEIIPAVVLEWFSQRCSIQGDCTKCEWIQCLTIVIRFIPHYITAEHFHII